MTIRERLTPEIFRGPIEAHSLEEFIEKVDDHELVFAIATYDVGHTFFHKIEHKVIFKSTAAGRELYFQQKLPLASRTIEPIPKYEVMTLFAAIDGLTAIKNRLPDVRGVVVMRKTFWPENELSRLREDLKAKLVELPNS